MAVNVTYLLGAGASFNAIPIVRTLANDIRLLSIKIKELEEAGLRNNYSVRFEEKLNNELIRELDFLFAQTKLFGSPDTYVKSLYLQKGQEAQIDRTKRILAFFLVIRHYLAGDLTDLTHRPVNIDQRYISFFASILATQKGETHLPDNINIVSWNYDFQIELALKLFKPGLKVEDVQEFFKSKPSQSPNASKIIRLNGMAGLFRDSGNSRYLILDRDKHQNDYEFLVEIVNRFYPSYNNPTLNISDSLTFAWEVGAQGRAEQAARVFSNTQILIVIGYSFPFFNREIDRELFERFINNNDQNETHDLKIYIQDPLANEDSIITLRKKFLIPSDIEIEPIKWTDQFFLPPEL